MNSPLSDVLANAGCLLFVADTCTPRERSDALDIILYTQLAASKKHSRFNASQSWSDTQQQALASFGWGLGHREGASLPASDLVAGNIWDWLLGELPPFMPASEIALARAYALTCYQDNPDQAAIQSYAEQVCSSVALPATVAGLGQPGQWVETHGSRVVLQLGIVQPGASLSLITIAFTCRQALPAAFLQQPVPAHEVVGNVELKFQALRQVEMTWSAFRQQISAALEARRPQLVHALQGGDHGR